MVLRLLEESRPPRVVLRRPKRLKKEPDPLPKNMESPQVLLWE